MGQNHPKEQHSDSLFSDNRARHKRRAFRPGTTLCSTGSTDDTCFMSSNHRYPATWKNDQSWKKHMITQLKSVEMEGWPQILLGHLAMYDNTKEDTHFQFELYNTDCNCAKKPTHYTTMPIKLPNLKTIEVRKQSECSEGKSSKKGSCYLDESKDSLNESRQDFQGERRNTITQDIKHLLATSAVLEEKVFEISDNADQIRKSLSFKLSLTVKSKCCEDRLSLPRLQNCLDIIPENLSNQQISESKRLTLRMDESSKTSNMTHSQPRKCSSPKSLEGSCHKRDTTYTEDYANNTFLIQKYKTQETAGSNRNIDALNVPMEGRRQNFHNEESLTEEEKLYRAVVSYKTLTSLIDKHLKHSDNIFCKLLDLFESYFEANYGEVHDKVTAGTLQKVEAKVITQKATQDLQQFIRILYETINMFYKLDKLKVAKKTVQGCLFNRDNMLTFITSIVFTRKIHKTVFRLYQTQNMIKEGNYRTCSKYCRTLTTKDFGVADEFSLDERTIKYLKEKNLIQSQTAMQTSQKFTLDYLDASMTDTDIKLTKNASRDQGHSFVGITRDETDTTNKVETNYTITTKPFEKAILALRSLEQRKSPLHKLKTIVKVAELIISAIEDFYKELGAGSPKLLDGDQTLNIFMYTLAKSGLKNVGTHCDIVQNFSTNSILDSNSGYYATTLEACVDCICNTYFEEAQISQEQQQAESAHENQE